LKPEDVRVMGNTVFIDLPDARILDSSLDEDKTSLYDRDRGLFRKSGNDELIEVARRDAEDRMVEAAKEHGILDKAQDNAKTSISTLITPWATTRSGSLEDGPCTATDLLLTEGRFFLTGYGRRALPLSAWAS
jgi:hypothetical protein